MCPKETKIEKIDKKSDFNSSISSFKKLKMDKKFGNQARIDLICQPLNEKFQLVPEIRQKKVLKNSKIDLTSSD